MSDQARILIVADDAQVGQWLRHRIETVRANCRIDIDSHDAFRQRLAGTGTNDVQLLFAVLRFGVEQAADSHTMLDHVLGIPGHPPIIVVAEDGGETAAVQSLRAGAADYLPRLQLTDSLLQSALEQGFAPDARAARRSAAEPDRERADPGRFTQLDVPRDLIPRYLLVDALGSSVRATVYLAHSAALDRHVALKVSRDVESGDAQFAREYEAIGGIRHPCVVDIYDYGMHEGREFIAMEYFPCGDLKARLQNPVSEREALDYLQRIARALAVVHRQGILHRDLKPPNIMLRDDAQIVLIDFGLAKSIDNATRNTAAGVLRGSPYYMSPEQAQGEQLDGRSDIYSLGIVFHELLTGTKPYLGSTAVEVLQQHVSGAVPELPPQFAQHQALLEGMLAKQRDERFATAEDLLAVLQPVAA